MAIAQRKKTRNADNINKVEDEHIKDEKTIFLYSKVPILYNSLIISTYEIGKRKRVTIWLLLKFPGLP